MTLAALALPGARPAAPAGPRSPALPVSTASRCAPGQSPVRPGESRHPPGAAGERSGPGRPRRVPSGAERHRAPCRGHGGREPRSPRWRRHPEPRGATGVAVARQGVVAAASRPLARGARGVGFGDPPGAVRRAGAAGGCAGRAAPRSVIHPFPPALRVPTGADGAALPRSSSAPALARPTPGTAPATAATPPALDPPTPALPHGWLWGGGARERRCPTAPASHPPQVSGRRRRRFPPLGLGRNGGEFGRGIAAPPITKLRNPGVRAGASARCPPGPTRAGRGCRAGTALARRGQSARRAPRREPDGAGTPAAAKLHWTPTRPHRHFGQAVARSRRPVGTAALAVAPRPPGGNPGVRAAPRPRPGTRRPARPPRRQHQTFCWCRRRASVRPSAAVYPAWVLGPFHPIPFEVRPLPRRP